MYRRDVMKRRLISNLVLAFAIGGASGCASSQINRIDRNRSVYESWPIEIQEAVFSGKVDPGMTPMMVEVAWGKPTEVITQSSNGDEIWVYRSGGDPGSVYYPPGSMGTNTGMGTTGIGMGGPGIGISTGRGGTSVGTVMGGSVGMGGVGGMGTPAIVTPPRPPDIKEVVFRNGVVHRADAPN